MTKVSFSITINASKEKVWEAMLGDAGYRQWTAPFQPGSHYEGNWEEGSTMRFIAPDEQGRLNGMVSQIVANRPYEYISIEHLGEIVDGWDKIDTEIAKQWAGAHENYHFSEKDGITTVTVELEASDEVPKEMIDMMAGMWPQALQILKKIAEEGGAVSIA